MIGNDLEISFNQGEMTTCKFDSRILQEFAQISRFSTESFPRSPPLTMTKHENLQICLE